MAAIWLCTENECRNDVTIMVISCPSEDTEPCGYSSDPDMGDRMDTEPRSQTTQTDQTTDGTGQTGLTTVGGIGQTAGAGQTLMEGYHGDSDSSSEGEEARGRPWRDKVVNV